MDNTNSSGLIVPPGSTNPATLELRDIKSPVEIPNYWPILWAVLAVAILSALIWWYWKRRRATAPSIRPEPVIPAHERAKQRLVDALRLIDQPRPFCDAVSDAIRIYVEERFELRAPERTTEEFLEELQRSALLSFEQKQVLGDFLTRCDLVKFARYEPGRDELHAIHASAVRLVRETQPSGPPLDTPAPAREPDPASPAP